MRMRAGCGILLLVGILLVLDGSALAAITFNGVKTFKTGDYPESVAVGDFNGDGKADLAVAGTAVTTLRGKGDGTFSAGNPSYFTGSSFFPSLAPGDFNGDAKLDLAVPGFYDNIVSIFINTTKPYPAASIVGAANGPE